MKNKKIFSEQVLGRLLFILILTSIFLSGYLWVVPSYYDKYSSKNYANNYSDEQQQMHYYVGDIIKPNKIMYVNSDHHIREYVNHHDLLSDFLMRNMKHWEISNKKRVMTRGDAYSYSKYLNAKNSLVLEYPSEITLKILGNVTQRPIKTNDKFNRIIIPKWNTKKIYILRDRNYVVKRVGISHVTLKKLFSKLVDYTDYYTLKPIRFDNNIIMEHINRNFVPQYYMTMNKNKDLINSIIRDSGGLFYHRKIGKTDSYYNRSKNKDIQINNKGGIKLSDYGLENSKEDGLSEILLDGVNRLGVLSRYYYNFNYFSSNLQNKNMIQFNNFINGLPILDSRHHIGQTILTSGKHYDRIAFSTYSFGVPIPTNRMTELPSYNEVIKSLQSKNINKHNIQGVQVGYGTSNINTNDYKLIHFKPYWFIKYKDSWTRLDKLK